MRTCKDFRYFCERLEDELLQHAVIRNNSYCRWFAGADHNEEDIKELIVQFSVFSNQFLVAQLEKMINAVDLQEMHAAKEILANELGCIFRRTEKESQHNMAFRKDNKESEGDPSLVNTEGTVDGGIFRFRAAHFEWLLRLAEPLDLSFADIGSPLSNEHKTISPAEVHRGFAQK